MNTAVLRYPPNGDPEAYFRSLNFFKEEDGSFTFWPRFPGGDVFRVRETPEGTWESHGNVMGRQTTYLGDFPTIAIAKAATLAWHLT